MSHVEAIRRLIKSVKKSSKHHAIIVEGPPGWGKTTTVEEALKDEGVKALFLGAYSTPLHFYNFISENPKALSSSTIAQSFSWNHPPWPF